MLFVAVVTFLLTPSDNGTSVCCFSDKGDDDGLNPLDETRFTFPFKGSCLTADFISPLTLSVGCDCLFRECRKESFVFFILVVFDGENDDNTEGRICADSLVPETLIAERETGFCCEFS